MSSWSDTPPTEAGWYRIRWPDADEPNGHFEYVDIIDHLDLLEVAPLSSPGTQFGPRIPSADELARLKVKLDNAVDSLDLIEGDDRSVEDAVDWWDALHEGMNELRRAQDLLARLVKEPR